MECYMEQKLHDRAGEGTENQGVHGEEKVLPTALHPVGAQYISNGFTGLSNESNGLSSQKLNILLICTIPYSKKTLKRVEYDEI